MKEHPPTPPPSKVKIEKLLLNIYIYICIYTGVLMLLVYACIQYKLIGVTASLGASALTYVQATPASSMPPMASTASSVPPMSRIVPTVVVVVVVVVVQQQLRQCRYPRYPH